MTTATHAAQRPPLPDRAGHRSRSGPVCRIVAGSLVTGLLGADEFAAMPALFSHAQALTTLGSTPLVVLTARESVQTIDGWTTAQDRMAGLSTNSRQRVVDATHQGLLGQEQGAEVSADAIDAVVRAVRTGSSLPS